MVVGLLKLQLQEIKMQLDLLLLNILMIQLVL